MATPDAQFKAVTDAFVASGKLKEGDVCYPVARDWWDEWCAYTGYNPDEQLGNAGKLETSKKGNAPKPGPIDNKALVNPHSDKSIVELKQGLQEHENFKLVPKAVWDLFYQWYGGGPAIDRAVVCVGFQRVERVELYPLFCTVRMADPKTGEPSDKVKHVRVSQFLPLSAIFEQAGLTTATDPDAPLQHRVWVKANQPETKKADLERETADDSATSVAEFGGYTLLDTEHLKAKIETFMYDSGTDFLIESRNAAGKWTRSTSKSQWQDFVVGDVIDVRDPYGKWYESRVRDVKPDRIQIHYIGYYAAHLHSQSGTTNKKRG